MGEHRGFRRPFKVIQHEEAFEVLDALGQNLAWFYFEDEPTRRATMKRLSSAQASWLARNFARLPELLEGRRQGQSPTAGTITEAGRILGHGERP